LVIITSPNNVHYSLAKQSLEKGLHVIIEKLMAMKSSKVKELAQRVQTDVFELKELKAVTTNTV